MCTALAPEIGYEAAAKLAKDAYQSGKTVRQMAKEQHVLPEKRLTELLDPWRMTEAGRAGGQRRGIEGRVRASFQNPALLQSVRPLLVGSR